MEFFIEIDYKYIKVGEISFNTFYCEIGFAIIQNMINDKIDISKIKIKQSNGKKITIDEFSKLIENKIKKINY